MLNINQINTMELLQNNTIIIKKINFKNNQLNMSNISEEKKQDNKEKKIRDYAIKQYQKTLRGIDEISKSKIS